MVALLLITAGLKQPGYRKTVIPSECLLHGKRAQGTKGPELCWKLLYTSPRKRDTLYQVSRPRVQVFVTAVADWVDR
jgi:hypothetical protein